MKVVTLVPMGYGGKQLDRGEVFDLQGKRNDAKLLGMKYIREYDPKKDRLLPHDMCRRFFANEGALAGHAKKKTCVTPQQSTKHDTAHLLDVDPAKVQVEL